MNRALLKAYRKVAIENGFSIDAKSQLLYGTKRGFEVFISQLPNVKAFYITIYIKRNEEKPEYAEINQIVNADKKLLNRCEVNGYKVRFQTNLFAGFSGLGKPLNKTMEALTLITDALRAKGYANACGHCGTSERIESYVVGDGPILLCESCYHASSEQKEAELEYEDTKKENIVGGLVGALLGSLIGGALIVILGQLGFVAALSGLVMGVCTLKGYEMMAGKLSKLGIIISIIVMIVMVYISNRLDYAIAIVRYYDDVDLFRAFELIPELVAEKYLDAGVYYTELAKVYLFTAAGAFSTIRNILKNQSIKRAFQRLTK